MAKVGLGIQTGQGGYYGVTDVWSPQQPIPTYNPNASGVKINSNTQAGSIQYGQTTLDKILNGVLSGLALIRGAGYVPTTTQPQTQQYQLSPYEQQLLQQQYYNQQNSVTGQAASDLENFVKNNIGVISIVGLGAVLFMSGRK